MVAQNMDGMSMGASIPYFETALLQEWKKKQAEKNALQLITLNKSEQVFTASYQGLVTCTLFDPLFDPLFYSYLLETNQAYTCGQCFFGANFCNLVFFFFFSQKIYFLKLSWFFLFSSFKKNQNHHIYTSVVKGFLKKKKKKTKF